MLREREDQLETLDKLQRRSPETWRSGESLADGCFEQRAASVPSTGSKTELTAWVDAQTEQMAQAVTESQGPLPEDQLELEVLLWPCHTRFSEHVRGESAL